MQHEVRGQQQQHIIQTQVVVRHVQHEHITQQHDEHVANVQQDIIVHDEHQGQHVQVERQVRHERQE